MKTIKVSTSREVREAKVSIDANIPTPKTAAKTVVMAPGYVALYGTVGAITGLKQAYKDSETKSWSEGFRNLLSQKKSK